MELASHDFYGHIFPQVTRFFGFFKNVQSRSQLVEKLFAAIDADQKLKKKFKKHLGDREIFKFLKDLLDASQNILLIIDGEKDELPEILGTYSEWGGMVRVMVIRKYKANAGDEVVFSVDPEFENLEYTIAGASAETERSESTHLDDIKPEVRTAYEKIKEQLL